MSDLEGNLDSDSNVQSLQNKISSDCQTGTFEKVLLSSLSHVDRSDSGMEESFNMSHSQDDSDDEIVSRRQKHGKKRLVIDDDEEEEIVVSNFELTSDDEQEKSVKDGSKNTKEKNDGDSISDNEDESDDEARDKDDIHENTKDKRDQAVLHSDNEDEHQDDGGEAQENVSGDKDEDSQTVETFKLSFDNADLYEADSGDEDKAGSTSLKTPFPSLSQKELDSMNNSDEEGDGGIDSEASSNSDREENEGDEGFDESSIDPGLLAKLKKMKGAAKTGKEREKHERKAKPSAEKMMELFSESQRLQRESRVSLPYHEPVAKSLDDFLARAEKKKQEYAALKRPKDMQKAQIIYKKLRVEPPKLPTSKIIRKHAFSQNCTITKSQSNEEQSNNSLEDSGVASQSVAPLSQASTVSLPTTQNVADAEELGEDDLPDLEPTLAQIQSQSIPEPPKSAEEEMECQAEENQLSEETDLHIEKEMGMTPESGENGDIDGSQRESIKGSQTRAEEPTAAETDKETDMGLNSCSELEVPPLQRDPSIDLFKSQSTVGEPDAKFVPTLQTEPSTDLFQSQNQGLREECELNMPSQVESQPSSTLISHVQETPDEEMPCSVNSTAPSRTCESKENENSADSQMPDNDKESPEKLEETSRNEKKAKDSMSAENSSNRSSKKSLLDKLKDVELPDLPALSRTPDNIICLDEETEMTDTATPKNPGLLKLIDRLARHSKKRAPKPAYDVDISIVEKEGEEGDKKELKLTSFSYHVEEEEKPVAETGPGSKLVLLKQQLGVGMRKKREEARERRKKLYNLENEEGFGGDNEEEKLLEDEEEAEMTDKSDTDDDGEDDIEDEEEFQLQFGQDEDDGKDYNPLLDNEAQDDDEDDEYSDFEDESNDVRLRFDVSEDEGGDDEDNEDEEEIITKPSLKKKSSKKLQVSDDEEEKEQEGEESNTANESTTKTPKKDVAASLDSWASDMTPMTRLLQDTQTQDHVKYRRENSRSPDLYSTGHPEESESNSAKTQDHHDSPIGSYNPHSQMLDADGYLKLTPTQRPRQSRISLLARDNAMDSSSMMGFEPSQRLTPGAIFQNGGSQAVDGDSNMKELMGLCSGSFGQDSFSEDAFPFSQNNRNMTQEFTPSAGGGEADNSRDSFHIMSDAEEEMGTQRKQKRIKRILTDSEDEKSEDDDEDKENEDEEADTELEDNDDEPSSRSVKPLKFTGFKDKKKGLRREYLEEEAELSGSEAESDEDLDLAEEDDILEEEEGDKEMAGVSEEDLREQVGKVHMKHLQDADDREVMRYKEMYLQDGDLYSEGGGRLRNFRWKNADDSSQQDMFANTSDNEQVDDDNEDAQWRKDRYEREKFIEETEDVPSAQDSQLLKLGQLLLKKKDSNTMVAPSALTNVPTSKPNLSKKGSFLSRGKDALLKLAKVAKATVGGGTSGKSQNFVFQTVESEVPKDSEESATTLQPGKRKAHKPPQPQQAVKKQKVDNTPAKPLTTRQNSIFKLLDP